METTVSLPSISFAEKALSKCHASGIPRFLKVKMSGQDDRQRFQSERETGGAN